MLESACKAEIVLACETLGRIYQDNYSPRAVDADPAAAERYHKQALALYQAACGRNEGEACREVANFFWSGQGVEVDHAQRYHFLGRACELGDAIACSEYGFGLWYGAPQLRSDLPLAASMLIRTCKLGHAHACQQAPQIAVDHILLHPPGTGWKDPESLASLLAMAEGELAAGPRSPAAVRAAIGAVCLLLGRPEQALAAFREGLKLEEAEGANPHGIPASDAAAAPYVFGIALAEDALGSSAARTGFQRFIDLVEDEDTGRPYLLLPRAQGMRPDAALRHARLRTCAAREGPRPAEGAGHRQEAGARPGRP
jgi:tetratricopeptide (TPR) repeat protein